MFQSFMVHGLLRLFGVGSNSGHHMDFRLLKVKQTEVDFALWLANISMARPSK